MRSFFTRIQNKFSASYGGRYIETILKEIAKNDSYIIKHLFPSIKERCEIELEYHFTINGHKRIADIAIIAEETHKLLALAEIKYDDHQNLKNSAQLEDYVKFCKKTKIKFLYLTQFFPPYTDINYLNKNGYPHELFSDFAIKIINKNLSELSILFVDFLRDKGLMMENITPEYIGKFLVRLFNPYSGQRVHSNIDMIQNIPEAFSGIMTNINVISQEISQHIVANRSPSVDFHVNPIFKFTKNNIQKLLDENIRGKITYEPTAEERNGGELYIYARTSLKEKSEENDWFNIEFGFCFSIKTKTKNHITELYSNIRGRHIEDEHFISKKVGNTVITNKGKCVEYFKSLMSENIDSAILDNNIKNVHIKQLKLIKENFDR